MNHPLQNEQQRLEHRRLKLKASQQHLLSIQTALNECETRIANSERPAALRDPVFAAGLPRLRERREELCRDRDAASASINREYHDLLITPSAEPVALKSSDSLEIDRLNQDNASLRTLCDNQRDQIRRLTDKLQAFAKVAKDLKVAP